MHTSLDVSALDIPFEYWVVHVTFGPFIAYLDSLQGYSTGELPALRLIVLAVFGADD